MKIKSQRDFWSGLLFVLVGVAFAWGAMHYKFGGAAQPGPAYFPFFLGVLLALLGGLILFKALSIESDGGDPIGAIAWRPLLLIVAALVFFGLALPTLGLMLTLPAMVLMLGLASAEFRWKETVLYSLILTLASWLLFVWGLKLSIPVWPAMVGA
ncbi:tripartite tricarboxylate transporter TctB family protein [Roseateles koreensis]|uniref:Tripartite tricarboxylate transporter TctB family protein n=1 Tax=Roseateles koreensis TaxID=2987526 RepID=A0ABT5KWE4_9BURK|nr:tripartite tricarboxylate transporter TctB family protein [Roseateles koreensis]MDC8787278.1 tripartite tricarboxylate transporter TctB family protein [Roseateles koreensis]